MHSRGTVWAPPRSEVEGADRVGHATDIRHRRLEGGIGNIANVIDRATVHHVARLARLRLDEAEEERMQSELNAILTAVEQLQDLDLDGVEPTSHVIALTNVLREDVPTPSLPQELALREGPDVQGDGFVVPKIG